MTTENRDSSSAPEKLSLIVFIGAIVIGNICVFITYAVRADGKHWSHVFILCMAFIDLFIGSFVLPLRFVNTYGNPLSSKLCAALIIGEFCSTAAIIYAVLCLVYTRLYTLKQPSQHIRRRYLFMLHLVSWLVLCLFYGIPFLANYSSYFLTTTSSTTSNLTSYCTNYTTSIYHPSWMAYSEIGLVYMLPFMFIFVGLVYLVMELCRSQPGRLETTERRLFREQRQMTWHVFLLGIIFVILWTPWITARVLLVFQHTNPIQRTLQITYYISILRSALFPLIYASTNGSFRGSFAIYRHRRIVINNRVWSINEQRELSVQYQRGY